MATDVRIRPLRPDDAGSADVVAWDALQVYVPAEQMPADEDLRRRRARGRIGHVQRTDPGGAWLAERGGKVVGVALAILREGIWGLSLLAVAAGLALHRDGPVCVRGAVGPMAPYLPSGAFL